MAGEPAPAAPAAPAAPSAPGSLTGTSCAPPQAGVISDLEFEALEPSRQSEYARVRKDGPQGGSEWRRRSDLEPDGKPKPTPTLGDPAATVTEHGRLRVIEGDVQFELSASDIQQLIAQKAQDDLRKTRIPPTPGDYKAELPPDLKLPDGVQIAIDPANPAVQDLAKWAHGRGFDQADFSQMLGFYASHQAREQAAFQASQSYSSARAAPSSLAARRFVGPWRRTSRISSAFGTTAG
jgi:hypothetical protein